MKRVVALSIAVLLLVGYGIAEGLWTKRWFPSGELDAAIARLERVPRVIGDWEGQDEELPAWQVEKAEMSGYLLRRYTQRITRESATLMIMCGRPRPTTTHTPAMCYPAAGYSMDGEPIRHVLRTTAEMAPSEFWVCSFQQRSFNPVPLRIYWAWSATGLWSASEYPRVQFAGLPAVYKAYIIHPIAKRTEALADDPTLGFLEKLVPELRKSLFAE